MMQSSFRVSPLARRLGWAGLLPQVAGVAMIASHSPAFYFAGLSLTACYAALILTFLGGVWWGLSLTRPNISRMAPVAAVAPSLVALGSFIPWMVGLAWPRPSLVLLAIGLLASPLVDRFLLAGEPEAAPWLALRQRLSIGLGLLTLAAAWL